MEWTGLTKIFAPHDYQDQGMRHLLSTRRCALWMPMGGGKTVVTLTALSALSDVEETFPALVLAPRRVALSVWPAEAQKWTHLQHLRVSPIIGSAAQRIAALRADADIYTMNYENIGWLRKHLGDEWPFRTIVADEATRLKSYRVKQGGRRAHALGEIAHEKVSRFIELTGTPAPKGLKHLWGQVWFLDEGKRLGSSYSAFSDRWFNRGRDGFSLRPTESAHEQITSRINDICLTVRGPDVDKPVVSYVEVDLPNGARLAYREMENEMFVEIEGKPLTAVNILSKTMKCRQLANGAVYDEDGSAHNIHDEKIEALRSVIEEANGAPVLVAYHFKHDLARLREAFPKARVLDSKPKTIADWNAGNIEVLFAHPASCGHGLNLAEGGNIICYFSVDWNWEEMAQILERVGPVRQKQAGLDRPVYVYYILAKRTVDRDIMRCIETDCSVEEAILEAARRHKEETRQARSQSWRLSADVPLA